ncbi:MAG: hypothetical protein IJA34_09375 [Lachnospiraceae bacterium]|nr:hypothetical protein [Lachnospiraceae bacterium]
MAVVYPKATKSDCGASCAGVKANKMQGTNDSPKSNKPRKHLAKTTPK